MNEKMSNQGGERHSWKNAIVREVSRLPMVDKFLTKRAEWMLEAGQMEKYLKPKIKYRIKTEQGDTIASADEGVTVVCVGAGKGHEMEQIDAILPHTKVIGLDPNDFYTKSVKNRLGDLAHDASYLSEENRAENMIDVPDASADGLVYNFVYHHVPEAQHEAMMHEADRVLKPDGNIFVAEDLVNDEEEHKKTVKQDRIMNLELSADNPHHYRNIDQWKEFFAKFGFRVAEIKEKESGPVKHGFFVLERIPKEKNESGK